MSAIVSVMVAVLVVAGAAAAGPALSMRPAGPGGMIRVAAQTDTGPRSAAPVFVLNKGRFAPFDVPFGEFGGDAVTLNDRGQIAGSYYPDPAATCLRSFRRDHRGRFSRIDFPTPGGTQLLDINDHGQIVGLYYDAAGAFHAFTLRAGRYTTIDVPGATYTLPFGVNNRGQIAGLTAAALPLTTASDAHGFVLRDGAGGPVTRVDVPGAVGGTAVLDINNAGALAGVYGNPNTASGPPPARAMPDMPQTLPHS
jgi:hypothetical protein